MDHEVEVVVSYFPTDSLAASGPAAAELFQYGPVTIPANSSHVFYQGPRGQHGLAGRLLRVG